MSELNKTIREIAAFWSADKELYVKQSTMAAYRLMVDNHIIPQFGELKQITEEDVQQFVLCKLQQGLSHKTVKDIIIVLKMIHRYGERHKWINHAEWSIKYPANPNSRQLPILSKADQRKLMNHIMENFTFRNFGIYLCLSTGMRIGEICALKWSDFNLFNGTVSVKRTIERIYIAQEDKPRTKLIINTPKTKNSQREIPLSKELKKILKSLHGIVNSEYYILTNESYPIEPRTYRNYFTNLLKQLEIPKLKFHGLRHSFATRCIESKCDYKTVSVLLGHADIGTTLNLYVHPNDEQKRSCIERMTKFLK